MKSSLCTFKISIIWATLHKKNSTDAIWIERAMLLVLVRLMHYASACVVGPDIVGSCWVNET